MRINQPQSLLDQFSMVCAMVDGVAKAQGWDLRVVNRSSPDSIAIALGRSYTLITGRELEMNTGPQRLISLMHSKLTNLKRMEDEKNAA